MDTPKQLPSNWFSFQWSAITGIPFLAWMVFTDKDMLETFLLSVICTLGVGLLAWFAFASVIGGVIRIIIYVGWGIIFQEWRLKKKVLPNESSAHQQPDKKVAALTAYIQTARMPVNNLTDEAIRLRLQNAGWGDADINAAFALTASGDPSAS